MLDRRLNRRAARECTVPRTGVCAECADLGEPINWPAGSPARKRSVSGAGVRPKCPGLRKPVYRMFRCISATFE